jgi:hypothetical protein
MDEGKEVYPEIPLIQIRNMSEAVIEVLVAQ